MRLNPIHSSYGGPQKGCCSTARNTHIGLMKTGSLLKDHSTAATRQHAFVQTLMQSRLVSTTQCTQLPPASTNAAVQLSGNTQQCPLPAAVQHVPAFRNHSASLHLRTLTALKFKSTARPALITATPEKRSIPSILLYQVLLTTKQTP